jgi:hypothetical protein
LQVAAISDLIASSSIFCGTNRNQVVNTKHDAEAIEARAKIRSACWNANRELFHFEPLLDTILSRNRMTKG